MSIFSNIGGGSSGNSVKNAFDTAGNIVETDTLNNVIETNTILIQRQSNARAEAQQAAADAEFLRRENKKLKNKINDAEDSESILSQTVEQLTNENKALKDSYEAQKEILKDWMVSQRAFKELAMKYGIDSLGKSQDEVMENFKEEKENVKNNTTKYGNDSNKLRI